MNNKLIVIILLSLICCISFGQSKKDLRSTVIRLQADSTYLENKFNENAATISSLNLEMTEVKDLNKQLDEKLVNLTLEHSSLKTSLTDSIFYLTDSIERMNMKLDSIKSFARIIHFVNTFYSSLELNDEENLRHYEHSNTKFDLENFNALISENARYSKGRVRNLSDDKFHDKYFIKLQSIEEIKFSLDRILVITKVLYSGDGMGLFYNEEQLTLRENKGLIKLTDWVDLDLYKMMPSMEGSVENFSRDDFYKWIDNVSR